MTSTLKTVANPEELVKIDFISGLRDHEAKLGPLDGIKDKPTMTLSEMTENLQFTTVNKVVMVKEELGYNFKTTFRKPSKKFTGSKGNDH